MKKFIPVALAATASFMVVFLIPWILNSTASQEAIVENQRSIIFQESVQVLSKPVEIIKMYDSGNLIGVLKNESKLNQLLEKVYQERYSETFPNTELDVGSDLYFIKELSYIQYEDVDEQILEYIIDKNSFTIETNAIEFSNNQGVYAILYVDDMVKYEEAFNKYLLYFVDEEDFRYLKNNQQVPELNTYGTRDRSVRIIQNISFKKDYVNPEKIKTSSEDILEYLRYGEGVEKEYYTVEPYDMIDGVATKSGMELSSEQIVNINDKILKDVDQVLEAGTKLSITYFESPIDIEVKKEAIRQEAIYINEPLLIEDPQMYQGDSKVVQEKVAGSENVLYEETWINGYLVRGERISSIVTKQPQQEIIHVGSKEIPGVGTGNFIIPVDNPIVSCRWGCYPRHRAVDFQNAYDRYGPIYASDRGTVKISSYHYINGYYMVIDHGNGYESYYGHMNTQPYFEVGDRVNQGEVIGQIGRTGLASGPHVHFFIVYEGDRRDPCDGFVPCR